MSGDGAGASSPGSTGQFYDALTSLQHQLAWHQSQALLPYLARIGIIPREQRYASAMRATNPSFMNGLPELLILRLLRTREMYGYEIVQAIRAETAEVVSLGEGVVYPVLHGLEKAGAITSRRLPVSGRDRIYYTLSPSGEARLLQLSALWSRLARAVERVLEPDGHAATA